MSRFLFQHQQWLPSVKLTIGSTTKQAIYTTGSGTSTICFIYIIEPGDEDTDGIRINTSITLNNSTIKDAQGNNAPLVINHTTSSNGILIDATAPVINSILIPQGRTYKTGDTLGFLLVFSEPVFFLSKRSPFIKMTIGQKKKISFIQKDRDQMNSCLYVIQTRRS
jgi:hypothetical protein